MGKANAQTPERPAHGVRTLGVVAVLLAAVLAGCSDEPPAAGPAVATLAVELRGADTIQVIGSVYNTGQSPMRLSGDCREWGLRATGPLGNVTVEPLRCSGEASVAPGAAAVRSWSWEAVRVHENVGGMHTVHEAPVDGPYVFEVTFRAPQGPLTELATHQQDLVPPSAALGEGPGTLGWNVWSWPGHAALENRGRGHVPVAWDPCGVGLSGVDGSGSSLVPPCVLEMGTFQLRPGFALHAPVEGDGAAAHLIDPAGEHERIVVVREGDLAGRSWFTGSWQARTGAPLVLGGNGTFAAHDTSRPGAVLVGSSDLDDPWVSLRNDGTRTYRYLGGCGMPWQLPQQGCTPEPRWLEPGAQLLDPDPPQDGVYRFYWTVTDVLGHQVAA